MYCTKCGTSLPDDAAFCHACGARVGEGGSTAAGIPTRASALMMGLGWKRVAGLVGLVGGILAMVGIFTAWGKVSGWMSVDISGWDLATNAKVLGENVGRKAYACIGVSGAIIGLVMALAALAFPKSGTTWGLLALAGVLAIAGSAWGISDIESGGALGVSWGRGSGVYLTLVGGILCLAGLLALKR